MAKTTKIETVSQTLRRVKEVKGRIATLNGRIAQSVSWEGETKPLFDFNELVAERTGLTAELVILKAKLMEANCGTTIEWNGGVVSVQQAIFRMAELKAEIELYRGLRIVEGKRREQVGTDPNTYRPIYEEVQMHAVLPELERIKRVEELQAQVTELNDLIESVNHRTRLPK